ncbi:MAG: hypothetical protein KKF44_02695 [Nanoarchaeota archaeon]|nr:hypothetical protein [Nanoarchaeota archaeon]
MEKEEVKQALHELFGSQIRFNKDFDRNLSKLKEGMVDEFVEWCNKCKNNQELGSVPPKRKFRHLYVFFRKIASDIRVTLIKEQNSDFIEIHLDEHKGYDDIRLKLGYKRSSYYGS